MSWKPRSDYEEFCKIIGIDGCMALMRLLDYEEHEVLSKCFDCSDEGYDLYFNNKPLKPEHFVDFFEEVLKRSMSPDDGYGIKQYGTDDE